MHFTPISTLLLSLLTTSAHVMTVKEAIYICRDPLDGENMPRLEASGQLTYCSPPVTGLLTQGVRITPFEYGTYCWS